MYVSTLLPLHLCRLRMWEESIEADHGVMVIPQLYWLRLSWCIVTVTIAFAIQQCAAWVGFNIDHSETFPGRWNHGKPKQKRKPLCTVAVNMVTMWPHWSAVRIRVAALIVPCLPSTTMFSMSVGVGHSYIATEKGEKPNPNPNPKST